MTRSHSVRVWQPRAFLTLVLLASASGASAGYYGAGIENSRWTLSESAFDCTLSHEVPGYGRAVFAHRAGERLQFYLEADVPLMKAGQGMLAVEAPAWRPGEGTRKLGYVNVAQQRQTITIAYPQSMMLVQGLLDGMAPTLTRQSAYGPDPVRVRLSNINFLPRYQQYRQCSAGLLPVNFDQIQRSRIPFAAGSVSLSDRDRQLLDNIAVYLQTDTSIEMVFVDGHTDASGSRIQNRVIAEQRAQAVADYLQGAGVEAERIVVRGHADQFPASRNPAENRRVTIRLQRQGEGAGLHQASDRSESRFSG